ncbi:patatin-like phospholipase family protein [Georgenia muralis]|uniref:Patatin-like phospholipase n=1 Tax=Georgenia muralis TaxID=154117 RepID=A0A3N5A026_9MICO|nr:patatin-like phospholipase family protein [Georgenia muralis]RPF26685.1 patatin-like phospholipase [Georgenia muralis]
MRRILQLPWRARPEVVGLVLSGAGARSSFQIGALRYLYDEVGITPQVISGTSAGAILGSVLAQAGDHAGQRRALAHLERLWLDMQDDSDMFTELDWYARLRVRGPVLMNAFTRRERRQGPLGRSFTRAASLTSQRLGLGRDTPGGVGPAVPAIGAVTVGTSPAATGSAAPLGGGAAPVGDGAAPVSGGPRAAVAEPAAGSDWNPISVVDVISAIREVGRARPDLEIIVRGAEHARSMYRPGPIVDRLLDPEVFDPARVATSGVTLRVAVVGLESGELRYVTETGRLVDRENEPVPDEPVVDLPEAIRASCAIPAVFPPVRLGSEHYVDGGVRETLPTEVAVEHLGATKVYAVVAPPAGVPRQESYAQKDMLSIVLRSTAGIMSDEELRDEVEYARAVGAVVITPDLDVHDALTIDPGLTAIAMAYGWLRAAEVVEGASPAEEQLTRDIIALRRDAWALEDALLAPPEDDDAAARQRVPWSLGTVRPPDPAPEPDLTELAELKHRLRALVTQAPRRPPGAEEWWRRFEAHPFEISRTPDWTGEEAREGSSRVDR